MMSFGNHSKLIETEWAVSGEDMGSEDFLRVFLFVLHGSKLHFVKLKIPVEALVCLHYIYLVRKEWNGSTLPVASTSWELQGCVLMAGRADGVLGYR